MDKIELAKEFTDMVKRHEKEALAMVTKIGTEEISEDEKEVLMKVMNYVTSLSNKNKLAQSYYARVAEEFMEL